MTPCPSSPTPAWCATTTARAPVVALGHSPVPQHGGAGLLAPFSGMGDSGVGREGGGYSREFFTEARTVTMRINRGEH